MSSVVDAVPVMLLRAPLQRPEEVEIKPLTLKSPEYCAGGVILVSVPLNEPVQSSSRLAFT